MNKQKGFSIIELMIAMVLSLLVLGGLFTIFISNKQNFELQKGLSMIQQNSRFVCETVFGPKIQILGDHPGFGETVA